MNDIIIDINTRASLLDELEKVRHIPNISHDKPAQVPVT